jgi:hypothetical protein
MHRLKLKGKKTNFHYSAKPGIQGKETAENETTELTEGWHRRVEKSNENSCSFFFFIVKGRAPNL